MKGLCDAERNSCCWNWRRQFARPGRDRQHACHLLPEDAAGPDLGPNVQVDVLLKDDAGQYFQVDSLGARKKAVQIIAPGTYRFSRLATSDSCGVFSA